MDQAAGTIVRQQMLIRVPGQRVFEAFVDPAITTKFWFTDSDGRLESGAVVHWQWRMYGASTDVRVVQIDPNRRIVIQWGQGDDRSDVEWTFDERSDGTTLVTITNDGFQGDRDKLVAKAIDSMGGFSLLLAVKAFLEHGIELNLVADLAPDAHV